MIYFIQAGENGPIKIGSSDDPEKRMADLQVANAAELKLLWKYTGDRFSESDIHCTFKHEKIRGEWFHPSRDLIGFISGELENVAWVGMANTGGESLIEIREYVDGEIMVDFFGICSVIFSSKTKSVRLESV